MWGVSAGEGGCGGVSEEAGAGEEGFEEGPEGCDGGRGDSDAGFGGGPDGYVGCCVEEVGNVGHAVDVGYADDCCGGGTGVY